MGTAFQTPKEIFFKRMVYFIHEGIGGSPIIRGYLRPTFDILLNNIYIMR